MPSIGDLSVEVIAEFSRLAPGLQTALSQFEGFSSAATKFGTIKLSVDASGIAQALAGAQQLRDVFSSAQNAAATLNTTLGATASTLGGVSSSALAISPALDKAVAGMSNLNDVAKSTSASFASLQSFSTATASGIAAVAAAASGASGGLANLRQQGAALTQLGTVVASAFAIPTAGIISAVKEFGDFDAALTKSTAIQSGISAEMRSDLSDAAIELSKHFSVSAKESAASLYFLASAGLTVAEQIKALPVVANFAKSGLVSMEESASILTRAQFALGLASKDAGENLANMTKIADVLTKADTLALGRTQEFADALRNKAATAMQTFNISLLDGVAILAAYSQAGIRGAQAGNYFQIAVRTLEQAAIKQSKAWKALGVDVFDASGAFRGVAPVLSDLESKIGAYSDRAKVAELNTLGLQQRSQFATLPLLKMGTSIAELRKGLEDYGGTSERVANNQMSAFNEQAKIAFNRITALGIGIGKDFVGVLRDFGKEFEPVLSKLEDAVKGFQSLPGPVREAAVIIAGMGTTAGISAGGLLLLSGSVIKTAAAIKELGGVSVVLTGLKTGVELFTGSVFAAVVGWAALATGVVAAAIIIRQFQHIQDGWDVLDRGGKRGAVIESAADAAERARLNYFASQFGDQVTTETTKRKIVVLTQDQRTAVFGKDRLSTINPDISSGKEPKGKTQEEKDFSTLGLKDVQDELDKATEAFERLRKGGDLTQQQLISGHIKIVELTDKVRASTLGLTGAFAAQVPFDRDGKLVGGLATLADVLLPKTNKAADDLNIGLGNIEGPAKAAAALDGLSSRVNALGESIRPTLGLSELGTRYLYQYADAANRAGMVSDALGFSSTMLGKTFDAAKFMAAGLAGQVGHDLVDSYTNAVRAAAALSNDNAEVAQSFFNLEDASKHAQQGIDFLAKSFGAGGQSALDFKQLGLTSQADLEELARKAYEAYTRIANGATKSAFDSDRAWLAYYDRARAAGETFSQAIEAQTENIRTKVQGVVRDLSNSWAALGKQISQSISNDLSRAVGDAIFQTGKLGDAFKKMGQDVVDVILNKIIHQGIAALLNSLAGVQGIVGKIGGWLGGIAPGAGAAAASAAAASAASAGTDLYGQAIPVLTKVAGATAQIPGAIAAASKAATSATSAATGAFGGLLSASTTATIGLVTGAVSAVSGIIGNFQQAAANAKLGGIQQAVTRLDIATTQGKPSTDPNLSGLNEDLVGYARGTTFILGDIKLRIESLRDAIFDPIAKDLELIAARISTLTIPKIDLGSFGTNLSFSTLEGYASKSVDLLQSVANNILDLSAIVARGTGPVLAVAALASGGSSVTNNNTGGNVYIGSVNMGSDYDSKKIAREMADYFTLKFGGRRPG